VDHLLVLKLATPWFAMRDGAGKRSIVSRTMTNTSKRQMTTLVLWSIVWAIAFVASAFFFKGNPVKDWIQSALFIGGITLWLWQSQRVARPRC
jgi:hypothetical protein